MFRALAYSSNCRVTFLPKGVSSIFLYYTIVDTTRARVKNKSWIDFTFYPKDTEIGEWKINSSFLALICLKFSLISGKN